MAIARRSPSGPLRLLAEEGQTSGIQTLYPAICYIPQTIVATELRAVVINPLVETTISFVGSVFLSHPGGNLAYAVYDEDGTFLESTAELTEGSMTGPYSAPLLSPVELEPFKFYYLATWVDTTSAMLAATGFTLGAPFKTKWRGNGYTYDTIRQNQNVAAADESVNTEYLYAGPL